MATYTALRGDPAGYHDAYGVAAGAPSGGRHLIIVMANGGTAYAPAWEINEVSFEDTDIFGTDHVMGHPGVIGLWLNDYAVGDLVDESGDPYLLGSIDPLADYVVPDLRPAENGYMGRRGRVWSPGVWVHDYP